jgi:hypothetical protein
MSINPFKKAEITINVAMVVVAVLLGGALVKRYFFTASNGIENRNDTPPIVSGTRISLSGVDWGKNGKTLLVVVSSGCHFCSDSAAFYRRLLHEVEGSQVRLVAVLPQQIDEAKAYLTSLNVPIDEVRQAPLSSLGVSGTPTLILVDSKGVVTESWLGKLPPDKESEVVSRLHSNSSA